MFLQHNEEIPEICYEVAYWNNNQKIQRRIVSAANRYTKKDNTYLIIPCVRHYSKEHHHILDLVIDDIVSDHVFNEDQGFVDQYSNYWTREEALIIASYASQINTVRKKTAPYNTLFSEDLY